MTYSSILVYSLPNGGPSAMVWGVRTFPRIRLYSGSPLLIQCPDLRRHDLSVAFPLCVTVMFGPIFITHHQWLVASIFVLCVGMSMAELASAAPTSGGVSHSLCIPNPTTPIMRDIALLLDSFPLFPSLQKPSLLDRRL